MVEIQLAYEGNLRTRAVHAPSGTQLITDAPKDNQGNGESFSPTDLVATALGSCMMTIMGIAGRNFNIDLTGATVRVLKEMATAPVRRIGKLTVEITVPRPTTEEQRRRLETAASSCPVCRSLHPDVQTPVSFRFGD